MGKAREVSQVPNTSFGFKNRLINSDMRIDQRNAGASVTVPSGSVYTVDRFFALGSAASKFTVQQNAGSVTPPTGFVNYLGCTSSSAYSISSSDNFIVGQRVEGFNMADLGWGTANASTVTLSFWVRSSLTGTFGGSIHNASYNRSYPFSYTISAANTWEQKSITISGDTSGTWNTTNGFGISLQWSLGCGSTVSGTAGSWSGNYYLSATGATSVVGTSGATFYITGVQLEKGSTATSFDYRPYGTEEALCQRYYQRTGGFYAGTQIVNETSCVGSYSQYVPLRASPTVNIPGGGRFHKPGVAFYSITSVAGGQDANGLGYTTCTIDSGAGAGTVGQIDFGFILSAEL
jgi:hypothetical protein